MTAMPSWQGAVAVLQIQRHTAQQLGICAWAGSATHTGQSVSVWHHTFHAGQAAIPGIAGFSQYIIAGEPPTMTICCWH